VSLGNWENRCVSSGLRFRETDILGTKSEKRNLLDLFHAGKRREESYIISDFTTGTGWSVGSRHKMEGEGQGRR
jgi:hypothetical protein